MMQAHAIVLGARRHSGLVIPGLIASWRPSVGMTLSEATPPQQSLSGLGWSRHFLQDPTSGHSDPDGGNNAYQHLETVDDGWHYAMRSGAGDNLVIGPAELRLWLKSVGGRDFHITDGNDDSPQCYIRSIDGVALSQTEGSVLSMVAGSNYWWRSKFYYVLGWAIAFSELISSTIATNRSFTGDVTKGFQTYDVLLAQHRCAALADQTGFYDWSTAGSPSQPFTRINSASPGWIAGQKPDLWQPNNDPKALYNSAELADAYAASHTEFALVEILAETVAEKWSVTASGVEYSGGLDTARKPFLEVNTVRMTADSALTGEHVLARRWDSTTNSGTLYVDGTRVLGPTVLAAPADVGTETTMAINECSYRGSWLSDQALSDAEIASISSKIGALY